MKLSNRQIQQAIDYYDADDFDEEDIDDTTVENVEVICSPFSDKIDKMRKPKKFRGNDDDY